jgi:hypothetical protein
VASQRSAKDQFYGDVYYITLNPNCVVQRAPKNLKKCEKSQIEQTGNFSVKILLLKKTIMFKSHLMK